MSIKQIHRAANVSEKEAREGILQRFPGSKIVEFKRKGRMYVASIKVAEFPPPADDEDAPDEEAPMDDAPTDDEAPGDPLDLGDDEGDDEGDKEPKLSDIMDLMGKIADKLGITPDGEDPLDAPLDEAAANDMPDLGAPPAGEALPAPVPEPAHKPVGGPAFSHVLQRKVGSRHSFIAIRKDAGDVNNRTIVAEAVEGFPGYRVAKVNRQNDGSAMVALVAKKSKG